MKLNKTTRKEHETQALRTPAGANKKYKINGKNKTHADPAGGNKKQKKINKKKHNPPGAPDAGANKKTK